MLETNPGEIVWTPFAGVGSEVCGAIATGRRGLGAELKPSYYRQMDKNITHILEHNDWHESTEQGEMFPESGLDEETESVEVGVE